MVIIFAIIFSFFFPKIDLSLENEFDKREKKCKKKRPKKHLF